LLNSAAAPPQKPVKGCSMNINELIAIDVHTTLKNLAAGMPMTATMSFRPQWRPTSAHHTNTRRPSKRPRAVTGSARSVP
jgi:hypothetical protein